jgi:PmbA protein
MADVLEKQYTAKKLAAQQDRLLELARTALAASPGDQTLVRVANTDSALTRFAGSVIHQNTFEREAGVSVEVRYGQRQGVAATNKLTPEGVKDAAERAAAAAKVAEPNPDLADMAEGPREYPFQVEYYEPTAACSPDTRAKLVQDGLAVNDLPGEFSAAGTLSTSQLNFVIANSRGIEASYNITRARYSVLWTGADSSGYAEDTVRNVEELKPGEIAVKALATAKRSIKPRNDIPTGRYTVVLDPECLATMLSFLSWLAFSGQQYVDGASAFCGKLGQPVTGKDITIIDDALDQRTMGTPCDMSGLPKQRLMLVENGVAVAVAHDLDSAKRAGAGSTAHATVSRSAAPLNLVFKPGSSSREQLIKDTERGILVSRFHYTNVVDPMATVITGMTRDGTFLIENGEVTAPLTNFRFTQSILEALANCSGIAADVVYSGSFWGSGCIVPEAIRLEDFNFSGKTDH